MIYFDTYIVHTIQGGQFNVRHLLVWVCYIKWIIPYSDVLYLVIKYLGHWATESVSPNASVSPVVAVTKLVSRQHKGASTFSHVKLCYKLFLESNKYSKDFRVIVYFVWLIYAIAYIMQSTKYEQIIISTPLSIK